MNPYTLPDTDLEALLQDDTPCGDATTHTLGIGSRRGRMVLRARYAMTLCGSEEAARMGVLRGLNVDGPVLPSGSHLDAGTAFLSLSGPADALHAVWKTAQTLVEYLSGIATCAAELLAAARRAHPDAGVVCTRKNFPGTKRAALKAILCAGASPHRISLSETLLIFPEHRAFLPPDESPAATLAHLRRQWPERPVVVEVAQAADALAWAAAGVDILQLEKMSPDTVAALHAQISAGPGHPRLAAAGGITPANAEAYVRAGARILVTSAPYFAPPKDVAVTLTPADEPRS